MCGTTDLDLHHNISQMITLSVLLLFYELASWKHNHEDAIVVCDYPEACNISCYIYFTQKEVSNTISENEKE